MLSLRLPLALRAQPLALSLLLLLLLVAPVAAQTSEPAKENSIAFLESRSKNFLLLIFSYEMDKARADSILQTQDMTKDIDPLLKKLEDLVRNKGAKHASCAATALSPGMRTALETSAVLVIAEGTLPRGSEHFNMDMTRKVKASGIETTASLSMSVQGTPVFIGTVPDVSPGKDQLLFARCVVQFLE